MPVSQVTVDGQYDFGWVKGYRLADPGKREIAEGILEKILGTRHENDWEMFITRDETSRGEEVFPWRVAEDGDPTVVDIYCGYR
ncbi:hypothetical protein DL546_009067 [Coniochaeta pulveracea]|uniref:Uncharacterized protein n=1 Tax=Coniochaeta pulveracea TaxID=177199 RepID=A0A420YG84_9PEZI|nr:hypothetical protein DL546_009067 [Coniochaeta pulveracea]